MSERPEAGAVPYTRSDPQADFDFVLPPADSSYFQRTTGQPATSRPRFGMPRQILPIVNAEAPTSPFYKLPGRATVSMAMVASSVLGYGAAYSLAAIRCITGRVRPLNLWVPNSSSSDVLFNVGLCRASSTAFTASMADPALTLQLYDQQRRREAVGVGGSNVWRNDFLKATGQKLYSSSLTPAGGYTFNQWVAPAGTVINRPFEGIVLYAGDVLYCARADGTDLAFLAEWEIEEQTEAVE